MLTGDRIIGKLRGAFTSLVILATFHGIFRSTVVIDATIFYQQTQSPNDSTKNALTFAEINNQNITELCVTSECIEKVAVSLSREWQSQTFDSWCNPNNNSGLVLIKVPKSASSTMAGMALRVGNRRNCPIRWQHNRLEEYVSSEKGFLEQGHFLVAPIRKVPERTLSSFYFHHVSFHQNPSRRGRPPLDKFVIDKLGQGPDNFVLNYTAPVAFNGSTVRSIVRSVEQVLLTYSFLVVVERMDDSLVVMAWLTGLDLNDLLTMSSKASGSYYHSGGRCIRIAKAIETTGTRSFLGSESWRRRHFGDYLLHAAAEASLDATISRMGRKLFDSQLEKLRRLHSRIDRKCSNETYFPCSINGTLQLDLSRRSCYRRDFGCGYRCIDRVTTSLLI